MGTGIFASTARFYIHDHLYSPVALTDYSGNVLERYEYDAYGNPTIWNADFTTERDSSNYVNPYLFTGRRVDILDSGSLKIQYNRNRYYDYYSGRWLQVEKLGMIPNDSCVDPSYTTYEQSGIISFDSSIKSEIEKLDFVRNAGHTNPFDVQEQYKDGLNLYEYGRSNPIANTDSFGLTADLWDPPRDGKPECGICGPDVTQQLLQYEADLTAKFNGWSLPERWFRCVRMVWSDGWDIEELHFGTVSESGSTCPCGGCIQTVTVNGHCYSSHEVNYWMWGVTNRLCGRPLSWTIDVAFVWASTGAKFVGWLGSVPVRGSVSSKTSWAMAGHMGSFSLAFSSLSEYDFCKPCSTTWSESFTGHWAGAEIP